MHFMRTTDQVFTERVAIDAEICGGKPFIRGAGISIAVILDALAQGLSVEEIVKHYPMLEREDIEAALTFATRLAERNGGVAMIGRPRFPTVFPRG